MKSYVFNETLHSIEKFGNSENASRHTSMLAKIVVGVLHRLRRSYGDSLSVGVERTVSGQLNVTLRVDKKLQRLTIFSSYQNRSHLALYLPSGVLRSRQTVPVSPVSPPFTLDMFTATNTSPSTSSLARPLTRPLTRPLPTWMVISNTYYTLMWKCYTTLDSAACIEDNLLDTIVQYYALLYNIATKNYHTAKGLTDLRNNMLEHHRDMLQRTCPQNILHFIASQELWEKTMSYLIKT